MQAAWDEWLSSLQEEDQLFTQVGGGNESIELALSNGNEFVLRAPDAEKDFSWIFQRKDAAAAIMDVAETENFVEEVCDDLGGIPMEAAPSEVFDLLLKKY